MYTAVVQTTDKDLVLELMHEAIMLSAMAGKEAVTAELRDDTGRTIIKIEK